PSARTTWKRTTAPSRMPVVQCAVTHGKLKPRIGRNAVASSVSTAAAVIQWKIRSMSRCRSTRTVPPLEAVAESERCIGRSIGPPRREPAAIDRVRADQHDAGAEEHPEQIPRDALEHLSPVHVPADSQYFHAAASRRKSTLDLGSARLSSRAE